MSTKSLARKQLFVLLGRAVAADVPHLVHIVVVAYLVLAHEVARTTFAAVVRFQMNARGHFKKPTVIKKRITFLVNLGYCLSRFVSRIGKENTARGLVAINTPHIRSTLSITKRACVNHAGEMFAAGSFADAAGFSDMHAATKRVSIIHAAASTTPFPRFANILRSAVSFFVVLPLSLGAPSILIVSKIVIPAPSVLPLSVLSSNRKKRADSLSSPAWRLPRNRLR